MGNFHCISAPCSDIIYQKYLPPIFRYRYPGEDWQVVKGANDWSFEEKTECLGIPHQLHYSRIDVKFNDDATDCWEIGTTQLAPRKDWIYHTETPHTNFEIWVDNTFIQSFEDPYDMVGWRLKTCVYVWWDIYYHRPNGDRYLLLRIKAFGIQIDYWGVKPGWEDRCVNRCTFKALNNSVILHEETRDVCPEVEYNECRLDSQVHKVTVKKEKWSSKIQVVNNYSDFDFLTEFLKFWHGYIPTHCIEIWKTPVLDFWDFGVPDGNPTIFTEHYKFIGQYCSSEGCPPPEYSVACNDDCESCPPNTCEVICDGHRCCYNDQGISVKELPL